MIDICLSSFFFPSQICVYQITWRVLTNIPVKRLARFIGAKTLTDRGLADVDIEII